jgi:hypothetical protein
MMFHRDKREVFPYIVVLKKKHERMASLIGLIMAFLFILLLIFKTINDPGDLVFMLLTIISFSGLLAYDFIQFRKKKKAGIVLLYLVALAALFFFPVVGKLAYLTVAIAGYLSTRPEEIGFAEDRIVFKTIFSRTISWSALNNALIKDGILTLDYKNNKLFQAETDDDEDNEEYDVSEEEFNEFCAQQLSKN